MWRCCAKMVLLCSEGGNGFIVHAALLLLCWGVNCEFPNAATTLDLEERQRVLLEGKMQRIRGVSWVLHRVGRHWIGCAEAVGEQEMRRRVSGGWERELVVMEGRARPSMGAVGRLFMEELFAAAGGGKWKKKKRRGRGRGKKKKEKKKKRKKKCVKLRSEEKRKERKKERRRRGELVGWAFGEKRWKNEWKKKKKGRRKVGWAWKWRNKERKKKEKRKEGEGEWKKKEKEKEEKKEGGLGFEKRRKKKENEKEKGRRRRRKEEEEKRGLHGCDLGFGRC